MQDRSPLRSPRFKPDCPVLSLVPKLLPRPRRRPGSTFRGESEKIKNFQLQFDIRYNPRLGKMLNIFSKNTDAPDEHEPGPFGPYRLIELINTGGMADLWQATNPEGQTVAVRKLLPKLRRDGTAKKRFVKGCEVLAEVHEHDYIVHYVEHGKIKGIPFMAMEYVEGANLKEWMANPSDELSQYIGNILIDMGEALEHVHDCGYMHLDFKPENVLVSSNWNVRLVDFDLALNRPEKPTKLAKNPGTPAYMSPEQLQRLPVDHRADIFAYGVSAYEIFTGQKPFAGATPAEILKKQLNRSEFTPPREINLGIPVAVEKTILKSLETDPNKRHGLLSVMLHELRTALYV